MHIGTRVPLDVALELTLTGDRIDAARAYALGLVNAVVPHDEVLATALGRRRADRGQRSARRRGDQGARPRRRRRARPGAAERLDECSAVVFASEDAKEGATAFVEKRAPVWQGR